VSRTNVLNLSARIWGKRDGFRLGWAAQCWHGCLGICEMLSCGVGCRPGFFRVSRRARQCKARLSMTAGTLRSEPDGGKAYGLVVGGG
jgi:hypothetical protein